MDITYLLAGTIALATIPLIVVIVKRRTKAQKIRYRKLNLQKLGGCPIDEKDNNFLRKNLDKHNWKWTYFIPANKRKTSIKEKWQKFKENPWAWTHKIVPTWNPLVLKTKINHLNDTVTKVNERANRQQKRADKAEAQVIELHDLFTAEEIVERMTKRDLRKKQQEKKKQKRAAKSHPVNNMQLHFAGPYKEGQFSDFV